VTADQRHDTGARPGAGPTPVLVPPPVPATQGWKPDPFRRFDARYWDGAVWTEQVLDGDGHLIADPEPLADPVRWLPREPEVVAPPAPNAGPNESYPPPPPPPLATPSYRTYRAPKTPMSGWKIFGLVCLALLVVGIGLVLVAFFTVIKPTFDEANAYLGDLKARELDSAQQRMCAGAVSDPVSDLAQLEAVGWQGRYDLTYIDATRGSTHISTVSGTVGANTAVIVHLGDECIQGVEIPNPSITAPAE
jgi:hypothetical protein